MRGFKKKINYLLIICFSVLVILFINPNKTKASELKFRDMLDKGSIYAPEYVDRYEPYEYQDYKESHPEKDEKDIKFSCEALYKDFDTKTTDGWNWPKQTESLPTLKIMMYQIGVINAPYVSTCLGTYKAGTILKRTMSNQITDSYEKSTSTTIGASASISKGIKASVDFFELSQNNIGQFKFEKEVTRKFSHTQSTTETYEVDETVKEDGEYFLQGRAYYDVFACVVYNINYKTVLINRIRTGLWMYDNYYSNKFDNYTYNGTYFTLDYTRDGGKSIVKYKVLDDGTCEYDDIKLNNNIIYY